MDAARLLSLIEDLESEIAGGYEERLTALTIALAQQRDGPGSDLSAPIDEARGKLETWLANTQVNAFVPSRRQMMKATGIDSLFCLAALQRITSIVTAPGASAATMAKRLETFRQELVEARKYMTQVRKGLDGLNVEADLLATDEYEVGIALPLEVLDGGHLDALDKRIGHINQFLRAIQELVGEEEREVVVRGVATGSLLLFVAVGAKTAQLVAKVIDTIASIVERVLRIKVLLKEMVALDAPAPAIEAMKKDEADYVQRQMSDLVKQLIESNKAGHEGRRLQEIQTQLTFTITHAVKLVDDGGTIEVSTPKVVEEEFTPPVNEQGQPVDPAKAEELKRKWEQNQIKKGEEIGKLRDQGAAIAKLPPRPKALLNLPEPVEPKREKEDDAGQEGKAPKKK